MVDVFQELSGNLFLILIFSIFFLPISLLIGCMAALYAVFLKKIKNRFLSYAIPFAIILLWLLFWASQEYPGPAIGIINYGYMLLYYPMIVVSLLPLANYFAKLKRSWVMALIVATLIMFISFTYGMMKGEQLAVISVTPPTYIDNLVRYTVSLLSTSAYVIAGYVLMIVIAKVFARYSKKGTKENR